MEVPMEHATDFEFTVESYNTDPVGRPTQTDVCTVRATTFEAAAAKAIYENLFSVGVTNRLRAKVSRLGLDGIRVERLLYCRA
jgi:hypothetical protein